VWRGELKKTSGGLVRDDLVKNSKGKIVSRRKSKQAGEQNNLGVWLRSKGDKFGDKPKDAKVEKPKPKVLKAKAPVKKDPAREKLARRLKTAGVPISKPKPRPRPKPKPAAKKAPPPKSYGKKKSKSEITVQNIPDKRESRSQRKAREERESREKQRLEDLEVERLLAS
jgi:hypothetical protein